MNPQNHRFIGFTLTQDRHPFSHPHNRPQRWFLFGIPTLHLGRPRQRGVKSPARVVQLVSDSLDFSQASSHGSQACTGRHQPVLLVPTGLCLDRAPPGQNRRVNPGQSADMTLWTPLASVHAFTWRWEQALTLSGSEPQLCIDHGTRSSEKPKSFCRPLWRRSWGALCIAQPSYGTGTRPLHRLAFMERTCSVCTVGSHLT